MALGTLFNRILPQVAIDFYDTAGQERFASMHPSYYFRAQSCVLVFDVTRKVTYRNLMQWYKVDASLLVDMLPSVSTGTETVSPGNSHFMCRKQD